MTRAMRLARRLQVVRGAVRRSLLPFVLALLLGGAFTYLQLLSAGPLQSLDESAHDLIVSQRSPESYLGDSAGGFVRDPRDFITIVAIDDRTLAELGAYNGGYPREFHAQVIQNLLAAPPRVIAMDVGFFEPTADDDELAAALERARDLPVPTRVILSSAGVTRVPHDASSASLAFSDDLLPTPLLAEHANVALANVLPDDRGTVRVMPLQASVDGSERPTLGLAAAAGYLRRPDTLDTTSAADSLQFAGRTVPVDDTGAVHINFFGPPSRAYAPADTFRVVSFVDVLRGRVDPSVWRGGIVFVGALGATGLADDYWTPVSQQGRKMSGVEIHANAAATLLSTNFLRDMSPGEQAICVLGLAGLIAIVAGNLELLAAVVICPILLLVYALASTWGLYAHGVFSPISAPPLAGLATFLGVTGRRALASHRQARILRQTLAAERAEAVRQACLDSLTTLPNRLQFLQDLHEAVAVEQQHGGSGSLLLVNLDQFKDVNDTLGHAVGDAVLVEVARRLGVIDLGPDTRLARLGADEFGVVLRDADAAAGVSASVLLLRALEVPIDVSGEQVPISASIGLVVFPRDGSDGEVLLRHADLAMQRAKEARTGYAAYAPNKDEKSSDRLALVASLRHAVNGDGLALFCQPKVACTSGELEGVEMLIRWKHPQRGMIPPEEFIPLAEKTGLIRPLSRWVIDSAVRHARSWLDEGISTRVALNLSTHDLQDGDLPEFIDATLQRWNVPPQLLSVEITETALLADPERAVEILCQIRALGVRASLDDFGTGYSSLTYLKQFALEELKIDRSFVRDLARGPRDREIVRSTVELGHRLGLEVVAEGVEDAATLRVLGELGCDLVQGYYVSRPMPCEDLPAWVRARGAAGQRQRAA
jgi:diguanylate cyclase (GGDEF)-like protein